MLDFTVENISVQSMIAFEFDFCVVAIGKKIYKYSLTVLIVYLLVKSSYYFCFTERHYLNSLIEKSEKKLKK